MKTPVIQNEPEPSASQPIAPQPDAPRRPTNLAGRMGRWSAHHWKTAVFGWLAFVVVAFAAGGRLAQAFGVEARRWFHANIKLAERRRQAALYEA